MLESVLVRADDVKMVAAVVERVEGLGDGRCSGKSEMGIGVRYNNEVGGELLGLRSKRGGGQQAGVVVRAKKGRMMVVRCVEWGGWCGDGSGSCKHID